MARVHPRKKGQLQPATNDALQRQAARRDALLLRIRELETQLKESEQRAASVKATYRSRHHLRKGRGWLRL